MNFSSIFHTIKEFLTSPQAILWGKALAVAISGIVFSRLVPRFLPIKKLHPQHQLVIRRVVRYLIFFGAVGWAFSLIGVSLQLLLGAAGILTVAIGFAAQTSASNLISGLFLMAEQPFRIGDVVKINDITGTIVSIELLSFRIRTFDNVEVRILNETMLKNNVVNTTKYPIRRSDLMVTVAYRENLSVVRKLLMDAMDEIPICLVDPAPKVFFVGYEDSGIKLQFSVWATIENFFELKSKVSERVKNVLDANGIEIPFPHRTLHTSVHTKPIPLEMFPHQPLNPPPETTHSVQDPNEGSALSKNT